MINLVMVDIWELDKNTLKYGIETKNYFNKYM